MKYLLLFSSLLLCMLQAQAQQRTIRGSVTDSAGTAIPGATVLVKGTNIGTAAGTDGHYEIKVPNDNTTLIFTSMGFQDREVTVGKQSVLNVRLQQSGKDLNAVVVMGFSKVERQHVASSVAQMDMKQAKTRPVIKLQEAFSGTIAGVTMQQGTNLPGSVPGSISIRGISTLQNSDPLVIVDGMEQSLTDIDPNQVKSITVLKDAASASMYGSRGANGVIIIETERGTTGKFKVDLNTWAAFQQPIDLPKFVNGADYMRLNNEARTMQGQTPTFSEDSIRKMETGELPSVDWLDEVMQRRANSQNVALSVSGGGGVGTFNLMLGHLRENGLNDVEGSRK
ncbi:MAG: carboxypeptidase-like regulatory domain-containing protein [Chitinophaga sp.]